jgi:hypothetical protein
VGPGHAVAAFSGGVPHAAQAHTGGTVALLRSTYLQVTPSEWKVFRTETELARVVGQDLIDTPRKAARFGLTLEETLRLQLHRKRVSVLTVHAAARQRR